MAPPALYTPRQTLARRLVTWLARRLQIIEQPAAVITSQEWSQEVPVAPAYPAINSTAAMASFPWVVAAVNAISTDIAGLPLVAQRGRGDSMRRVPNHGGLVALKRPASSQGPTLWRRQMVQDLLLSGNSYTLMLTAPGSGRLASLVRLEPELVEVVPGPGKTVRGYAYGEAEKVIYDAADVVHIRQTSWRAGVQSLLGDGAIEPLKTELSGEYAAGQRWQEEAGRGRAGMLISPKEEGGVGAAAFEADVATKVLQRIQTQLARHGAAAVGAGVDVAMLPFSARDMEFIQARTWTRDAVLAVFGVVGTRVGLPNANYATAREAMAVYWQNLKGLIALIEDGMAQVAERAGRAGDRIVHDLSDVEVLQESRTDRLARARMLMADFGLSAAAALAYEGFDDLTEDMFSAPAGQGGDAGVSGPEDTTTEAQRNVLRFPEERTVQKNAAGDSAPPPRTVQREALFEVSPELPDLTEEGALIQTRFRFIASTEDEDRHGDIVRQNWRLGPFKQNPVILWNHDHGRPPIARATNAFIDAGRLVIDMEFDAEDPFAMEIAGKIQRRFISAGSVGFISHKMTWREDLDPEDPAYAKGWGQLLDDNELMEFSITPVQSNREALEQRKVEFQNRHRSKAATGELEFLNHKQDAESDLSFLEQ